MFNAQPKMKKKKKEEKKKMKRKNKKKKNKKKKKAMLIMMTIMMILINRQSFTLQPSSHNNHVSAHCVCVTTLNTRVRTVNEFVMTWLSVMCKP